MPVIAYVIGAALAAVLTPLIVWGPHKVYSLVLDGLGGFVEAIPAPSFISGAAGAFSNIPAGVMYFADTLQLGTGITIVITAYILRFLIRRIPIIG